MLFQLKKCEKQQSGKAMPPRFAQNGDSVANSVGETMEYVNFITHDFFKV